jgi:hypothetical protein
LLRTKENNSGKYNVSGVYQLQCADYPQKYAGQRRRTFKTRFKEHIRDIKYKGQNCKFAQHMLDTKHEYQTMEKAMILLHIEQKGQISHIRNQQTKHSIKRQFY